MSRRSKFIIDIIVIILILGGSIITIAALKAKSHDINNTSTVTNETKKPVDVTGNKEKGDITTNTTQTEKEDGLRCIISSAPYFKEAKSMGNFCISNHSDNEGYLLQVEITDSTSGEVIYISPLLNPGEKVQEDYLINQEYKDGSYPATALFNFYNAADQSFYYSIPFEISINIGGDT
ncbi:MAG: hypothetical protein PHF63_11805 [Herbinix sp.]|nr:hypothetical protein [Herbinix sp.]